MLIVDGTLVPTRGHSVAEQSQNYRYSTNHQVVVDADTRLVVIGRPLPGNVFARMKCWKILRDCRLKGDGVLDDCLGRGASPDLIASGAKTIEVRIGYPKIREINAGDRPALHQRRRFPCPH
ncbi:hypothetical protein GCM10027091_27300 [Streptomyces daliensis]